MKLTIPLRPIGVLIGLCAGLTLAYPVDVSASEAPPQVSKDGLQLKTHTKQRLVYVKPGATFNQYNRVMILDCYVEMQKDWQRNYNANVGRSSTGRSATTMFSGSRALSQPSSRRCLPPNYKRVAIR